MGRESFCYPLQDRQSTNSTWPPPSLDLGDIYRTCRPSIGPAHDSPDNSQSQYRLLLPLPSSCQGLINLLDKGNAISTAFVFLGNSLCSFCHFPLISHFSSISHFSALTLNKASFCCTHSHGHSHINLHWQETPNAEPLPRVHLWWLSVQQLRSENHLQ